MARTLDQILATEKPAVVAKAREKAAKMLLDIHLADLREFVQKTQGEVADALGIRQPSVAEMEKPGHDLKLSSLKRRLDVKLPDGTHYGFSV